MLALVSGASRGIGRAIAIEFAKKGYDVCINYHEHGDEAMDILEEVKKIFERLCLWGRCFKL